MVDQKKVEQYYDIVNEACCFLFEKCKMKYMESLINTANSILMGKISFELDEKFEEEYQTILEKLNNDYNTEEVRKALQFLILSALKEEKDTNVITPDTIAFLINYLVDKLYGTKEIAILDPLVGSGNLLFAIANNRESSFLYGIDIDEVMIKLAMMMGNLLNQEINLYNQDTLEVRLSNMDLVVADCPTDVQFTYQMINHHRNTLKDEGYMIMLINDDFFVNVEEEYRNEINKTMQMFGLIELPNDFFIGKKKSIVIMKKTQEKINKFLLASMPSVKDKEALNNFLIKLETWFKKGGN